MPGIDQLARFIYVLDQDKTKCLPEFEYELSFDLRVRWLR